MPDIGEHKVPWKFGDQCKKQKISAIFSSVMGVEKAFHQKKTENRKGTSSDIPADPVKSNWIFVYVT